MRLVFMGTPKFSLPVLEGLIENYDVVGVVTQPDKLVGRKQVLTFSPVKELALKHNIKVLQPQKIRVEYAEVLALEPDIIITCAYGQIIPDEILDYPKYGCINVHASLLPKYRGGAPIHWSIINGEKYTGVTIMDMVSKMDAGDMISQEKLEILEDDTRDIVEEKLSIIGRDLLLKTLPSIIDSTALRTKQIDEEVTFGYNIKREDEKIDFNKTTSEIYNQIRGLYPEPGCFAYLDDSIVKIYKARKGTSNNGEAGKISNIYKDGIGVNTKDGEIIILEMQLEGKKKMLVKDYLNGIDKTKLQEKVFK